MTSAENIFEKGNIPFTLEVSFLLTLIDIFIVVPNLCAIVIKKANNYEFLPFL